MLTTEECPEINVGTGKFSDYVEMTVEPNLLAFYSPHRQKTQQNTIQEKINYNMARQYNTIFYNTVKCEKYKKIQIHLLRNSNTIKVIKKQHL